MEQEFEFPLRSNTESPESNFTMFNAQTLLHQDAKNTACNSKGKKKAVTSQCKKVPLKKKAGIRV